MKLHGIWRGDEDRDAAPREPGEERYDVLVEQQSLAPQRLIEKDRARRAYERLRESQPLQQAGREVAHSTGRVYLKRNFAQCGIDLRGAMCRRQVVQRRVVLERFANGEEGVVAGALRTVGEAGWHVVSGDLLAEPRDRAVVAAEKSRQAEQECRFSGSRPADQANDLAAIDIKIHFAKRGDRSGAPSWAREIGLGETPDAQRAHDDTPRR